jgi:hypothetical protein
MNLIKLSALLLLLVLSLSLPAQANCTNANLNGTLFYTLAGSIKSNNVAVSYAEQGQVTADGAGNFSTGQTTTSTAGVIAQLAVSGTYTVNGNCSGTATLSTSAQSFTVDLQIVDGGSLILSSVTSSVNNLLGQVRFYRAANATGSQCGNGSVSGAYGALSSGGTFSGGARTPYETETQFVVDGNGGITSWATQVIVASENGPTGLSGTGTYSISSNCSGTAQINLTNGNQLNYVVARIAGGTILFLETDTATTISGSANPQLLEDILPQFVFGAGTWYSAIYFSNPTAGTVSFPVVFTSTDGTPLMVPGVGSSKQITIAPNGTAIIQGQNTGSFGQGYASFALPAGVTGYGVFRQTVTGRANQEALVGFKSATGTATSLIFDETSNLVASVAMVNSSNVAATVAISVWDNEGNLIGTAQQLVPAGNQVTSQLDQLAGLSGMVGKQGSALFTVPSGNISVLGLRFAGGGAFTSIPTTQVQ